jgi:hypothetical protein
MGIYRTLFQELGLVPASLLNFTWTPDIEAGTMARIRIILNILLYAF